MSYYFSIGFRCKFMSLFFQQLFKAFIILDDSVMSNPDISTAVCVRMGIFLRDFSMSGPSGVQDQGIGAGRGGPRYLSLQIGNPPHGFFNQNFTPTAVPKGKPRRIITPVLQSFQCFNPQIQGIRVVFSANVTNYSTHVTRAAP